MDRNERQAWGPLIRVARTAAHLSQDELAEQAGTTRRTVGSIERGDSVAQRDVLERILKVLGLTPEPAVAADIAAFLAMIEPLLQLIDLAERQRLMPEIVRMLTAAIAQPTVQNVTPIRPDLSEAEGSMGDEHLVGLPSAAEPKPKHEEPDEESEHP